MIPTETEIEPMLVDVMSSSDDSVVDVEDAACIDALWWEVGELLEEENTDILIADLDLTSTCPTSFSTTRIEKKRDRTMCTTTTALESPAPVGASKRTRRTAITEVPTPPNKMADEDDIKREIRMARNRASAERTRLRRLEHIKVLETKAVKLEEKNEALYLLLKQKFGKTDQELNLESVPCTPDQQQQPSSRKCRTKKTDDAKELLRKIEREADVLAAEEVARLRKEARMARNRASAERTRLRRLEAARQLEVRVSIAQAKQERLSDILKEASAQMTDSEKDGLGVDDLLVGLELNSSSSDETFTDSEDGDQQQQSHKGGRSRLSSLSSTCSEHEVVRHEMVCKTRPVTGDLQIKS